MGSILVQSKWSTFHMKVLIQFPETWSVEQGVWLQVVNVMLVSEYYFVGRSVVVYIQPQIMRIHLLKSKPPFSLWWKQMQFTGLSRHRIMALTIKAYAITHHISSCDKAQHIQVGPAVCICVSILKGLMVWLSNYSGITIYGGNRGGG